MASVKIVANKLAFSAYVQEQIYMSVSLKLGVVEMITIFSTRNGLPWAWWSVNFTSWDTVYRWMQAKRLWIMNWKGCERKWSRCTLSTIPAASCRDWGNPRKYQNIFSSGRFEPRTSPTRSISGWSSVSFSYREVADRVLYSTHISIIFQYVTN